MTNLYIPIFGLLIALLTNIVFFSKKRIKSKETELYKIMLITSLIDSIILSLIIYLGYINRYSLTLIKILNKIDFIMYLLWMSSLFLYVITIDKTNKLNKIKKVVKTINIIFLILIIIAPVLPYNNNGIMYVSGLSSNILYVSIALYLILIIIYITKNKKNILNTKYIPLYILILIIFIVLIIRKYNPTLIITSAVLAFINIIMYFTIENPDIKMLEQIRGANAYASKNNYEKEMFLYSVSKNLKGITNYIKSDGSKINNLSNDKEIKDLALNISLNSSRINSYIDNVLEINENNIKVCDNKYDVKQLLNNTFRLRNVQNISLNESIPRYLYGDNIIFKEALINLIDYLKKNFSVSVNYIVNENICRILVIFNKENIEFTEEVQKIKEKLNQIGGNIVFGFQDNEIIAILDQKIVLQNNDKKILVPQNIDISRYVINEKIIFTKYDCVKDFFEKALEKYDLILLDKDLFDDIYLDKNVIYEKLGYEPIIKLLSNKKNNGYNIDVIDLKKFEELIKHLEKD